MNELTTEDPYGIFAENVSLESFFNLSENLNETIKEEDGPSPTTLMVSAVYLTVVGKAGNSCTKL